MTIGIIDVGIGNIGSLRNAVESQGWDVILVSRPEDFNLPTHVIIPGVGAFSAAMTKLNEAKIVESLITFAKSGNPVMGICLGMQILADIGVEGGETAGLGLIPGGVVAMENLNDLRLPHVGWNDCRQLQEHPILKGVSNQVDFYFVHSYRFVAKNQLDILAETQYGEYFPSVIGCKNIVGTQFHPEKSQINGLRILDNFCAWNGIC